ncbi:MAG TPA: SRPBCC domain-containing protein [Lysobacter sp.]
MPTDLAKSLHIHAPRAVVWHALTDPASICAWTSDEPLTVATDWRVGAPIVFRGVLHGRLRFENTGTVRAFEPQRLLEYSHYSSLSRRAFADEPDRHALVRFSLAPAAGGTRLELLLGNLHDDAVRGHMDFHWDMTLPVLKRFCEAAVRD